MSSDDVGDNTVFVKAATHKAPIASPAAVKAKFVLAWAPVVSSMALPYTQVLASTAKILVQPAESESTQPIPALVLLLKKPESESSSFSAPRTALYPLCTLTERWLTPSPRATLDNTTQGFEILTTHTIVLEQVKGGNIRNSQNRSRKCRVISLVSKKMITENTELEMMYKSYDGKTL
eukprot:TRINITY_DN320_c0_g4_i2.p4 TRINITY_DN320_c0_g4~~TRINITY_DN320_c0_g4_i2.p4  ORF type:complete len:178 (+),score=14.52 TRINITY_DN320_c0_g4_i2:1880-2413(+)